MFSALGLYFVTSNDLSRLLMLLLRQIPPPHSVIFKYIIIIKIIPAKINKRAYFIILYIVMLEKIIQHTPGNVVPRIVRMHVFSLYLHASTHHPVNPYHHCNMIAYSSSSFFHSLNISNERNSTQIITSFMLSLFIEKSVML